jgi:hypothetical protein
MTDRESADAVIEQWNGKIYPGSDIPLQVRFADTPMQKSTSLVGRQANIRAEERYRSSSKLACKGVQLFDSGSPLEPWNTTLLRRTIRSRKFGLSCRTALC